MYVCPSNRSLLLSTKPTDGATYRSSRESLLLLAWFE